MDVLFYQFLPRLHFGLRLFPLSPPALATVSVSSGCLFRRKPPPPPQPSTTDRGRGKYRKLRERESGVRSVLPPPPSPPPPARLPQARRPPPRPLKVRPPVTETEDFLHEDLSLREGLSLFYSRFLSLLSRRDERECGRRKREEERERESALTREEEEKEEHGGEGDPVR